MPLSTWAATLSSTCANRSFSMTQTPRLSHESRGVSYVFPAVGEGLSSSDFSGANLRPWWGRSAGVTFCRQKVTKDRQRRGPSPALWNPPRRYGVEGAPFSIRPWTGSGHIDGGGFYRTCVLLCVLVLLSPVPYPWCAAVSSYRKHAPHPRVLPSPMAPLYKGSCLP